MFIRSSFNQTTVRHALKFIGKTAAVETGLALARRLANVLPPPARMFTQGVLFVGDFAVRVYIGK